MKRSLTFLSLLLLGQLLTPAQSAEQTEAASAYLNWRGGDALSKIESLSFKGTLESAGIKGRQAREATEKFIHEEMDLGIMKAGAVIGPDGNFARTPSGQVQVLGIDLRRTQERMLDFLFASSGRVKNVGEESKNEKSYRLARVAYENNDSWDYFIAADGRLDWIRVKEDNETYWIELTNWRETNGVRFAHTERVFYKQAERNTHSDWQSIEVNPSLSADAFKRIKPERKLLSFASGNTSEKIAVDLFMGVRVFVPVTINGVETLAILDSGAESTGIDAGLAARAGITGQGAVGATGSGGTATVSVANNVDIDMPGARLSGITIFIADLSALSARFGRPLEVILGQELFNEAVVDVDYPKKTVTFYDAESFRYSGPGETVPLIAGKGGLKQVELSIEGHGPELFDFDLGNGSPLIIVDDAATRWGLLDGRKTGNVLSGGIGGSQVVKIAKVRHVAIGPYVMSDVPTLFPKTDHGSYNTKTIAGNVGAGIFNRFRVIADLTRDVLHLEPDEAFLKAPFEQDRSGLFFTLEDETLKILHVVPGSAAAAAGLVTGDVVKAIGATSLTSQNWAETARAQLRQPVGTAVKITLADGREVTLTLAEYY
jgi:hypothetical protein